MRMSKAMMQLKEIATTAPVERAAPIAAAPWGGVGPPARPRTWDAGTACTRGHWRGTAGTGRLRCGQRDGRRVGGRTPGTAGPPGAVTSARSFPKGSSPPAARRRCVCSLRDLEGRKSPSPPAPGCPSPPGEVGASCKAPRRLGGPAAAVWGAPCSLRVRSPAASLHPGPGLGARSRRCPGGPKSRPQPPSRGSPIPDAGRRPLSVRCSPPKTRRGPPMPQHRGEGRRMRGGSPHPPARIPEPRSPVRQQQVPPEPPSRPGAAALPASENRRDPAGGAAGSGARGVPGVSGCGGPGGAGSGGWRWRRGAARSCRSPARCRCLPPPPGAVPAGAPALGHAPCGWPRPPRPQATPPAPLLPRAGRARTQRQEGSPGEGGGGGGKEGREEKVQ